MNKERQKYLLKLLDSYCLPIKRHLMLFIIAISLTTIAQVLAITQLISVFLVEKQEILTAWLYLVLLVASFVLKAFCIKQRTIYTQKVAGEIRLKFREQVLERCQNLGSKGLGHSTTSLSILYLEQVELINNYIARFYPQSLASRIQPVLIVIAVFCFNWAAGLVLVLTSPLLPIFMILIGIKTSEMNAKQLKSLLYLGNQFHDKLSGIRTIIAFSQQKNTLRNLARYSQNYTETSMELLRIAFLNSAVLEFLSSICIALMALYFGLSYIEETSGGSYGPVLTLLSGYFCLTLAGEFFQPLKDLGAFYHDRSSALNAVDELEKFINQSAVEDNEYLERSISEANDVEKDGYYESSFKTLELANTEPKASPMLTKTSSKPKAEGRSKGSRRNRESIFLNASQAPKLEGMHYPFFAYEQASLAESASADFLKLTPESKVCFQAVSIYTHSGKLLLENLNFIFTLNQKVALIGGSGVGKTTVLSALLGQLPYQGSISIDGIELTDINAEQYLAYLSWLGQNPNLDQVSVLANLSFNSKYLANHLDSAPSLSQQAEQAGNEQNKEFAKYLLKAQVSNYSILQACEIAAVDPSLSQRLDQVIEQYNHGFSGGQIQRLALARALAKPHLFLIMDEPTANLDFEAEELIIQHLNQLEQGLLMVTHRLNHLDGFDLVLEVTRTGVNIKQGDL